MTWLVIGIGGFLGANVRYFVSDWLSRHVSAWLGVTLPYGTAFVNITGSCLLALFIAWTGKHLDLPANVRFFVATGFFGAYTTFSTYANESITLLQRDWRVGVAYIVLSNGLCLLGVVLGWWLAERLWGI